MADWALVGIVHRTAWTPPEVSIAKPVANCVPEPLGAEMPIATLCAWFAIAGRFTEELGVLMSSTTACEMLPFTRLATALVPPTAVASPMASKVSSRLRIVPDAGSNA